MSSAALIDGKEKARQLTLAIKNSTAELMENGIIPGLAVIIIGEDPASQVYVRNKKRTAEECGFYSVQHTLDKSISEKAINKHDLFGTRIKNWFEMLTTNVTYQGKFNQQILENLLIAYDKRDIIQNVRII